MLIRTIEDLKKYGAPNLSLSIISINPYIYTAEQDYLIPYISTALYGELNEAITNEPSEKQAALIEKLRWALAPLAIYYYTGENEITIGDQGLIRNETEDMKTAYNNQVIRTRTSLLSRGLKALDVALEDIQKNKDNWAAWTGSEQYELYNSLLIRSGNEFKKHYPAVRYPQQFYATAASLMEVVERIYIEKDLGETFTDLKAKKKDNSALTVEEKVFADTIAKSICYYTVAKAITELQVRLDDNGLSVLSSSADKDQGEVSKRQAADGHNVSALQRQCESIGMEYCDFAIDYLNKTASAAVFAKWYANLQAAANTPVTTTNTNESLNGLFSL
jgi:hypothetical protein